MLVFGDQHTAHTLPGRVNAGRCRPAREPTFNRRADFKDCRPRCVYRREIRQWRDYRGRRDLQSIFLFKDLMTWRSGLVRRDSRGSHEESNARTMAKSSSSPADPNDSRWFRLVPKGSFDGTFRSDFTARAGSNALASLNWNSRLNWTQRNFADCTRLRCKPCDRRRSLAVTRFYAILWAWSPKLPSFAKCRELVAIAKFWHRRG